MIKPKILHYFRILSMLIFMAITINLVFFIFEVNYFDKRQEAVEKSLLHSSDLNSFELNIIGYPMNIVPNIVHYILFTIHEIQFAHFVSLLSVLRNQKPDLIYIHCDCHQLNGEYYRRVLNVVNKTNTKLIIRNVVIPTEIFGHRVSDKYLLFHASDITRIRVLKEFGGIYLDVDVYVVKSLDDLFKYEMTLDFEMFKEALGSQVLVAHKNARFLSLWLDCYRNYNRNNWYETVGEVPAQTILKQRPELIHRMNGEFGVEGRDVCPKIYSMYFPNWRKDYYTMHLFLRNDYLFHYPWCLNGTHAPQLTFSEISAKQLKVTFGEMTREVFDYEKSFT